MVHFVGAGSGAADLITVRGMKLLGEALEKGAEIRSVLWKERAQGVEGLNCPRQYLAPAELFDYASPMKNSPGPVFTVAMERRPDTERLKNAIVLETVQDPGNRSDGHASQSGYIVNIRKKSSLQGLMPMIIE